MICSYSTFSTACVLMRDICHCHLRVCPNLGMHFSLDCPNIWRTRGSQGYLVGKQAPVLLTPGVTWITIRESHKPALSCIGMRDSAL